LVKQAESASVAMQRFAAEVGDASLPVSGATGEAATRIEALRPDGFQVGTHATVNAAAKTYYWVAFEEVPGGATSGSYLGTGVDGRAVTGLGIGPQWALVRSIAKRQTVHRPASIPAATDLTLYLAGGAATSDRVQSLLAGGFTVGTNAEVNKASERYFYFAI